MGFKESTAWILFFLLFFPLTSIFTMFYLVFSPWPVHKELEKTKAQRSPSPLPVDELEMELDRMRGEMGMNQMKKKSQSGK